MNTSNRRNRWRSGLLLALVALTAAACAEDKPLNIFEPQGPQADRIHGNTMFILWMATAVFVATFAGAGYIIWKNRVSEEEFNDGEFPDQVHGNPTLEWGWTALPGLILAVVAVVTVPTIFALEEKNEADELDVMVGLGPVIPYEQHTTTSTRPSSSDLGQSQEKTARHANGPVLSARHPTSRPASSPTGRGTIYA